MISYLYPTAKCFLFSTGVRMARVVRASVEMFVDEGSGVGVKGDGGGGGGGVVEP